MGGRKKHSQITNNTDTCDNICLKSSRPETNLGKNTFSIGNNYSYHLFGTMPSNTERLYRTIQNCWLVGSNETQRIFLFIPSDTLVPIGYVYQPTSCNPTISYTGSENIDQGFGVYDTIRTSNYDSTGVLPDDEMLYSQAVQSIVAGNYPDAITNYKALIDNFPLSNYLYTAEFELYDCYYKLDTSSNQNTTDILYGDLKQFLETKINSPIYDAEFINNAYNILLMCATRMQDYEIALTGYEFLALYHPDAEQRVIASWEYDNIEDLLQGMGGGKKDNYLPRRQADELGIKNYELKMEKRMKKLDELIDRDPITKHLKERYEKINKERKSLKQIPNSKESKKELMKLEMNINEDKLIERSKENIYLSKSLSKEEKEIRLFEDMELLLNPDNLEVNNNNQNLLPTEYNLSQNYPNPFNPNTVISYQLPVNSFVSLKIYDILGKEVARLVNNEFKVAGKYIVDFNARLHGQGSDLASGVYFYRMEVEGDPSTNSGRGFIMTKRMVLIK